MATRNPIRATTNGRLDAIAPGVVLIISSDSVPIQGPPNIAISPFDDEFGPGSMSIVQATSGSAAPNGGEHTVSEPYRGCVNVRFGRPRASPGAESCTPPSRLCAGTR